MLVRRPNRQKRTVSLDCIGPWDSGENVAGFHNWTTSLYPTNKKQKSEVDRCTILNKSLSKPIKRKQRLTKLIEPRKCPYSGIQNPQIAYQTLQYDGLFNCTRKQVAQLELDSKEYVGRRRFRVSTKYSQKWLNLPKADSKLVIGMGCRRYKTIDSGSPLAPEESYNFLKRKSCFKASSDNNNI